MPEPRTLYDKIWESHLVDEQDDGICLLYIDRHLVHEVTSPQAFDGLRAAGRKVRRPEAALDDESFERGLLEHPQYTRPAEWEGRPVPEVVVSGHHARIRAWRRAEAERVTRERRPDLWARYEAGREETD